MALLVLTFKSLRGMSLAPRPRQDVEKRFSRIRYYCTRTGKQSAVVSIVQRRRCAFLWYNRTTGQDKLRKRVKRGDRRKGFSEIGDPHKNISIP